MAKKGKSWLLGHPGAFEVFGEGEEKRFNPCL
jgi:hypothetical protein